METFPSVYRERDGFFHRFLSIYSSIYNDFEQEIDDLPRLLDPETAQVEMLPVYGQWLGIDLSGDYLTEEMMRTFVREGYKLNRMKGTKRAIERILEIILREKAIVIEHNQVKSRLEEEEMEIPDNFRKKGIYDVTVLVKRHLTEELRHQILFRIMRRTQTI